VFICAVVGESFPNDDGSSRQEIIQRCLEGEWLLLVPEPNNPFDPNAIAVRRASNREQIGYLKRDVAASLTEDLENQFAATAIIHAIRGGGPGMLLGVSIIVTLTDARGTNAGNIPH
jgi:hypothetical protein